MWKSIVVILLVAFSSVSWSFLLEEDNFLMYFNRTILSVRGPDLSLAPISLDYNNQTAEVNYTVTSPTAKDRKVDLIFKYKGSAREDIQVDQFSLSMWFTEAGGYFALANTTSNIAGSVKVGTSPFPFGNKTNSFQLISEIGLEAPKERSFHCNRFGRLYPDFNARVGNYTPSVEFGKLQIQLNGTAGAGAKAKFQESWDCVGFFSAGIWSGIFIAAILIGIITLGLAMIMDVKTNDKFDDPKGKPVSFGGTE